ncbi:glycyl-radical enzyme activating protein [Nibricoccus sp. IMCC34717]|uniref:glycyl-radical enzyme activating protein n=1 Tax=Nibricoccus sp. IMCC34717 TaxID=3034021 RepID=UPI00384CDD35
MTRKPSSAAGGYVFDVQRSSLHDGPGIRTTLFLKGCPLRCLWCHNPESQAASPELSFDADKCSSCRACETVCIQKVHTFEGGAHRVAFDACEADGHCVAACPNGALRIYGGWRSTESLLDEVEKDRTYYEISGGGLTLSGGEPTVQPEFSLALLSGAKARGIHTALETCGISSWSTYERFLPVTDVFLYDYKATGTDLHRQLTGVDNTSILANLRRLHASGARIILRCPLLPGVNATDDHLAAIRTLRLELRGLEIDLLPYHDTGNGKYARLGRTVPELATHVPEEAEVERWKAGVGLG